MAPAGQPVVQALVHLARPAKAQEGHALCRQLHQQAVDSTASSIDSLEQPQHTLNYTHAEP